MIPIIERSKLLRAEWARNFSDTTTETITQIIESTRTNQGHEAAEATAKEIRLLIETDISEEELVKSLSRWK